jgi:hypothetical protein
MISMCFNQWIRQNPNTNNKTWLDYLSEEASTNWESIVANINNSIHCRRISKTIQDIAEYYKENPEGGLMFIKQSGESAVAHQLLFRTEGFTTNKMADNPVELVADLDFLRTIMPPFQKMEHHTSLPETNSVTQLQTDETLAEDKDDDKIGKPNDRTNANDHQKPVQKKSRFSRFQDLGKNTIKSIAVIPHPLLAILVKLTQPFTFSALHMILEDFDMLILTDTIVNGKEQTQQRLLQG